MKTIGRYDGNSPTLRSKREGWAIRRALQWRITNPRIIAYAVVL